MRLCLLTIRLLRAGLTIFVKRSCTISRTYFTSSALPRSCIIFSKSARESHTSPPAKLLRQNSTGLATDLRFHSAFDVRSSDPFSSDMSLPPLGKTNVLQAGQRLINYLMNLLIRINSGPNIVRSCFLHCLPVSAWNFATVSFSSIHSANTVGERSNFLTLALNLFSVGPFQSTRCRYSCIRNWVVRWSPCALGTRTRTLCSPLLSSTLQTT